MTAHDCPELRSKGCPLVGAPPAPQASVSVKLGRPLKSLWLSKVVSPLLLKFSVSPSRGELELLASAIVCVDAAKPSS